jgi:hypothetical protein
VSFVGINYLAVVVAGVAGWLVGAAWYSVLARPWMIALGKTRTELLSPSGKPSIVPFVISLLASAVMAFVLAWILGRLGSGEVSILTGAAVGFFAWLGFVVTTLTVTYSFSRQRIMLTLIDGGHWLAVLVLQGAVIGLFGPR